MSGTLITRQIIPVMRPFVGKEEEQDVLEMLRSGWRWLRLRHVAGAS